MFAETEENGNDLDRTYRPYWQSPVCYHSRGTCLRGALPYLKLQKFQQDLQRRPERAMMLSPAYEERGDIPKPPRTTSTLVRENSRRPPR